MIYRIRLQCRLCGLVAHADLHHSVGRPGLPLPKELIGWLVISRTTGRRPRLDQVIVKVTSDQTGESYQPALSTIDHAFCQQCAGAVIDTLLERGLITSEFAEVEFGAPR